MNHNQILITINDHERLTKLINDGPFKQKMPAIVDRLNQKFKTAKLFAQDKILRNVVTMNSRVLLKELNQSREAEVTIAYPQDADGRDGRISVFSPIGLALLGRQVGDQVSWTVPSGIGQFEIIKIIFQPEALGHYHL